jgi:hypothetical protein
MVVNTKIITGSQLVQADLDNDKFIYNDQIGAVYSPDPYVPVPQEGRFKYTIAPPLLNNFAWNRVKLNWTRYYDTALLDEFKTVITLEGILPNGQSELLAEQTITDITTTPTTEDITFDLLNNRGDAFFNRTPGTAAAGKVQVNLPKPWINYQNILLMKSWMDGWLKRKGQAITAGSSYYDSYPVKITVPYVSGMKSDFSDVRFTLPDALTPLCIYRYSYTAGSTADFYINYPTCNSAKSLFMYYGNSAATLHSNIDSVFPFADDFNDNSLDSTKWKIISGGGGSIAETGGVIRVTSDGSNRIWLKNKTSRSSPHTFEFMGKKAENIEVAWNWDGLLSGAYDLPKNGYYLQYAGWTSPAKFTLYKMVNGSQIWLDDYAITLDGNYHNYKVDCFYNGTTLTIRVYYESTLILESFDAGPISNGYLGFSGREAPAGVVAYYDFVRCLPYMATRPAQGTVAGEESITTGVSPDSATEEAMSILFANGDGFRRPRYLTVTEHGRTAHNTNAEPMVTREVFNLGYNGVDIYAALRLGVKVLGDPNINITFNNLEYAYEVI